MLPDIKNHMYLVPSAEVSPARNSKISSPAAGFLMGFLSQQVPGQQLKLTATPDGAPRNSCPPGDTGRGSEVKYCDFHFGAFCFRGDISAKKNSDLFFVCQTFCKYFSCSKKNLTG